MKRIKSEIHNMETDYINMMSLKLDKVMEDIGVTEEIIEFRRHVNLLQETMRPSFPGKDPALMLGSQCEGSTTIGMESDTDILYYSNELVAYLRLPERLPSNNMNILQLTINTGDLPQCCRLKLVIVDDDGKLVPASLETMREVDLGDQYVLDHLGRVLLSHRFVLTQWATQLGQLTDNLKQHGPAVSSNQQDYVFAIHCFSMPEDCQVLFTRPNQPGHWPKQETILKAKECGVYLVAPGNLSHTFIYNVVRSTGYMDVKYSDYYLDTQWRMSTNMIERLLMFDLNIVEMKAYVLTKMIRKEFLKPIVGDRLSTFHMKTALMFTLEHYPKDIWRKDNLVLCVLYCLNTLRRFLKRRMCPHYTVASVNLFAVKLEVFEFSKVIDILTVMINSKLRCIQTLRMDNVGERLSLSAESSNSKLKSREENRLLIITDLVIFFIMYPNFSIFDQRFSELMPYEYLKHHRDTILAMINDGHKFSDELLYFSKAIANIQASILASDCIKKDEPITEDVTNLYEYSLSPLCILNYLKYASMCVSTQQYSQAEALLQYVESILTGDLVQISYWSYKLGIAPGMMKTTEKSTPTDILMEYASKLLPDVVFERYEMNCVPTHLVYEMYRVITEDDHKQLYGIKHVNLWFNQFCVEPKPFLFYLQYLSSNDVEKKQNAVDCLYASLHVSLFRNGKRSDTIVNMIGHVCELENQISKAWEAYRYSISLVPRNNAANWHLFRLLGHYVYGHYGNQRTS